MEKKDNEGLTLLAMDETEEDAVVTPWSIVHYLSGAAMKGLGISFPVAFAIHALYEAKDRDEHSTGRIYNSMVNSVGDQTVAMLGWYWTKESNNPRWLYYFLASWVVAANLRDHIG